MKLFQALKRKNRLASELAQLRGKIKRDNCWDTRRPNSTNVAALTEKATNVQSELIVLKSQIAAANVAIYPKIELMSELKSEIVWWRTLDVRKGTYTEGGGFREAGEEVSYDCHYAQADVDAKCEVLQARINDLQDEIDAYNASTEI